MQINNSMFASGWRGSEECDGLFPSLRFINIKCFEVASKITRKKERKKEVSSKWRTQLVGQEREGRDASLVLFLKIEKSTLILEKISWLCLLWVKFLIKNAVLRESRNHVLQVKCSQEPLLPRQIPGCVTWSGNRDGWVECVKSWNYNTNQIIIIVRIVVP